MKFVLALCLLGPVVSHTASPIGKVVEMISEMQAKIQKEGAEAQATYEEAAEWCEDKSKDIGFEIKTGKAQVEDLTAKIEETTSLIAELGTKIEDLAAGISENEADLKKAAELRTKEAADHAAEAEELSGTIGQLSKAINTVNALEKHGSASMLQMKNAKSLEQAFSVLVQAREFSSADATKLTALIQSSNSDDDENLGAPSVDGVQSHTGGIADLIQGLYDKAEANLEKAQQKEKQAIYSFMILKKSLEDEIKNGNRDMSRAKKDRASNKEELATAQGDLAVTQKDLAEDEKAKAQLHQDCMSKARDFEAETKSRGEELNAVATAKKIIIETTGAAVEQLNFLQVARTQLRTSADLANLEAVHFLRDLAKKTSSSSLAQLATSVYQASRNTHNSKEDIFAKVRGLIEDMIGKLEDEAAADAQEKAYCDKELAETNAKYDDLKTQMDDLSTKIDQMTSKSAQLKEEVSTLQNELAKMAKSEAEMDKIRLEEKALYTTQRSDMSKGLNGVKLALKVLRDYYNKADKAAHGASSDSAGGIMNLLEVCESDFSKALAEIESTEQAAVEQYDAQKKENKLSLMTKNQDIKYKTKEAASLDKSVTEASSDKSGVSSEFDAVVEYLGTVKEKCIAKPESYEERKARREQEIAGLKQAMDILEGEAVLVQKTVTRRVLRGSKTA